MHSVEAQKGGNDGAVYSHLLAQLREDILSGKLAAGSKLPGENEMAKTHGISRWAVREMLAKLAEGHLVRTVSGIGTIVIGDYVKRARPGTVAIDLIIDDTDKISANEYAWSCQDSIRVASQAMRRPFDFRYRTMDFTGREREDLESIREAVADVSVVVPFSRRCRDFLEMYGRTDRLIVAFAGELSNPLVPQVFVDDVEGVRKGTEYLRHIGHRRIAMIAPTEYCYRNGYSLIRQEAFVAEMRAAGCEWTNTMVERCECAYLPVRAAVGRWLARKDPPTAFFIADGNWISPVKAALDLLGKKVPDDITLISYDDVLESRAVDPPVTVIRQTLDIAARQLCETIVDHFESRPEARVQRRVIPELIVRGSSCPPGFANV
jgi:DNA-binding LacI/PurR family transcriptional regulator/DNA-binding transcriptional regulator YhcF (GntR family)